MAETQVRIINAALDTQGGSIILRGRIDPTTLDGILVDDYQREILPMATIGGIIKGFKDGGSIPDLDLGMRGARTRDKDDTYVLLDPTYVIDGLQRLSAAKQFRLQGGDPRIGAVVHFNTTKDWENERFRILNADRNKLATNVLVRNERGASPVVAALYSMSMDDTNFVMKGHVCWQQRQNREHFITATSFVKTVGMLHSHLGAGRYTSAMELVRSLEQIMEKVGRNIFRENIRSFYGLLDNCWGVRTIAFKSGATHLKLNFLLTLARLLSNHEVFWREHRFFIDAELTRKLKGFPIGDRNVQQLAGSSGQARQILYQLMLEHLNSGKRTRKLRERAVVDWDVAPDGGTSVTVEAPVLQEAAL